MLKIMKVLITGLMLFGLYACGVSKEREETVQLIWWGGIYNQTFAGKLINKYNGTNPEIKVSLITPVDYWMKLQTMIAGGTPPDIFLLNPSQAYELADRGALLSLDDYKTDPAYISFRESVWKALKNELIYKGRLYAIPIWTNSIGMFYNKDLFDKAGVEYPTKDWTFEELLEKAKLLTIDIDNDGRIDQYGFGGFPLSVLPWSLDMLIKTFGGELYSEDMKKCLIDTPEAVEAVKWAMELVTKYHVAPTPSEVTSRGVVSASGPDLFQMGKVAIVYWGRWYLDTLSKKPDLRWAVAPYPRGKRKVMYQEARYLGISSKTRFPKASWEFVKFVVSENGQKLLSLDRTDIPVRRSVAYSPELLNYAGREDANRVFLEMLEYAEIPSYLLGKGEWLDFARMKLELALLGKISVEEACREIAREFEKK